MCSDTLGRYFRSRLGKGRSQRLRVTTSQLSKANVADRNSASSSNTHSRADASAAGTDNPPPTVTEAPNARYVRAEATKLEKNTCPTAFHRGRASTTTTPAARTRAWPA